MRVLVSIGPPLAEVLVRIGKFFIFLGLNVRIKLLMVATDTLLRNGRRDGAVQEP
jgi:hypothetical protein